MSVTLLVGTIKGAFVIRSNSDRTAWELEDLIFKGWKVTAATRAVDGTFFIGTASDIYGPAIQRSTDLKQWEQVKRGPQFDESLGRKLNQIWFISTKGDTYYAGADEAGLFQSRDGGNTWKAVNGLNDHDTRPGWRPGAGGLCAHAFLRDPSNPDRMWCGISAVGVFRTDDGGATWSPKNSGVQVIIPDENNSEIGYCVHALTHDPENPDVIWQQNHRGMYRTTDGGDHWESIQNGLPSTFGFPLERDPHTGSLFCFPQESDEFRVPVDGKCRVYRSHDNGDSWHPLGTGLPKKGFYGSVLRGAMAVDELASCGVYFGTTSGTMHMSKDCGDTWITFDEVFPRILCVSAFISSEID